MWLLSTDPDFVELRHSSTIDEEGRKYAILSHVWQVPEQSFQEIRRLQHEGASYSDSRVSAKVRGAAYAARKLGYLWIWIDTCCIDKTSSAELEEAINSMFRWYAEADMCFAYLSDVTRGCRLEAAGSEFRLSRWFERGWTLQELIAPHFLIFVAQDWTPLGTKAALASLIEDITGIDAAVLTFHRSLHQVSVARRMSWAASRKTSRVEDEAYSVMGLFDVSMPTIYGEGRDAFRRLQEEIMKRIPDHSLFAWGDRFPLTPVPATPLVHRKNAASSLLASSPSEFKDSAYMTPTSLSVASELVSGQIDISGLSTQAVCEHRVTSYGVRCDFIIVEGSPFSLAILPCKNRDGRCVALILWPRSHPTSDLPQYRVGAAPYDAPELPGYRLLLMEPSAIPSLRRMGWKPGRSNGSKLDSPITTPTQISSPAAEAADSPSSTPASALVSAKLTTVFVANLRASTGMKLHGGRYDEEPQTFFIPSWFAPQMSNFDLWLEDGYKTGPFSGVISPPATFTFRHGHARNPERFTIHLGRCKKSLLFAYVSIRPAAPEDQTHHYAQGIPLGLSDQWPCSRDDPALPAHYHVNSWPNGSICFGDAQRTIRVTATRWPGPTPSYCLEVRLEGSVYASFWHPHLIEPTIQDEHRNLLANSMPTAIPRSVSPGHDRRIPDPFTAPDWLIRKPAVTNTVEEARLPPAFRSSDARSQMALFADWVSLQANIRPIHIGHVPNHARASEPAAPLKLTHGHSYYTDADGNARKRRGT
ncbi:heterokaryon incompatibility protein-domain-containing protein [Lenzites betulinus]|nr:heterokaryon incompatibility protein-domain-containing protein [Lenzites betulinus]